jgi:hypothetical protein
MQEWFFKDQKGLGNNDVKVVQQTVMQIREVGSTLLLNVQIIHAYVLEEKNCSDRQEVPLGAIPSP